MPVSCFHRYVDFIKYAIAPSLNDVPNTDGIDWRRLYKFVDKQAILGIVFEGVKRLSEQGIKPPFDVLMDWIAIAENIERRNKVLNKRCDEVQKIYAEAGFVTCILKGQGNAQMYPNPLSRMPGDIDLWVKPDKDGIKGIIKYVRKHNPRARAEYHHIDYGDYNGVEVEVHYRPSFSNNLIYNRRLQKWFYAQAERQYAHTVDVPGNAGSICVPTFEFNIIFQLSHIYRHLIQEGIGLRQVIDYYYLLKSNTNCMDNTNICDTLRYLGLVKIAEALMWVLHEILGLPEKYLIASKDEKRGRVLLGEILRGGNFGQYDDNNRKATTAVKKNIQRIKRDLRMMRYFPSECLWEPVFRVYHWIWRMKYN